jgi:transposase InsO family protein
MNCDGWHTHKEEGIEMQHTVPYTPQQNGVAERKNRILKEMETCMLKSKGLHPSIWAEAINYATYLHNIVPHKGLKDMTPFEAWMGYKPDVSHLRVFGSRAWARIPAKKRRSLDPQSRECIMVGYALNVKAYNILLRQHSLIGVYSLRNGLYMMLILLSKRAFLPHLHCLMSKRANIHHMRVQIHSMRVKMMKSEC